MERLTVIKFVLLLTILIGNKILSVTNKILSSRRNNCTCGEIGIFAPHRITGGKVTEPHAYPWQALILRHNVTKNRYISPEEDKMCGGTVINNKYILTAAHCVTRGDEENLYIVLGVHDRNNLKSKGNHFYNVVEIIIHENAVHKYRFSSDIAILKVNRWIKFNKFVKPICLQNQYEQIVGKKATVIGWGHTKHKGSTSDFLKEAPVEVLRRKLCMDILKNVVEYDYTMFCAYGGIHDACAGDSGGPLFFTNQNGIAIEIGMVSNGYKCGIYPGVYTKISTFLDWIHKNTNDATYCKRKL